MVNGTDIAPCMGIGAPHIDIDSLVSIDWSFWLKIDDTAIAPKREWCPIGV